MATNLKACVWALAGMALAGCTVRPPLSPRAIVNKPGQAGLVQTGLVLVPGVGYSTNQNVLLRSQDSSGRDYDMLAGPFPKMGAPVTLTLHNSISTLALSGDAFIYGIGKMPISRSKRVIVGTEGTEYAIRVNDAGDSDLVVVISSTSGKPVNCTLLDASGAPIPSTGINLDANYYVTVKPDGAGGHVFGPVTKTPGPADPDPDLVRDFLKYVESRAMAASLTTGF
ncbi:MAG: hypothetical protein JSR77_01215 [Planctomycetes bacterium]|nr:hypothetical protein [Planctomycetota bacterium]